LRQRGFQRITRELVLLIAFGSMRMEGRRGRSLYGIPTGRTIDRLPGMHFFDRYLRTTIRTSKMNRHGFTSVRGARCFSLHAAFQCFGKVLLLGWFQRTFPNVRLAKYPV